MDKREEKAIVIAALCKLQNKKGLWVVPSQSANDRQYVVDPNRGVCTCLDHQDAGHKCKHIRAVEIVIRRERASDGTVTETKSITFTEKKTYTQAWPEYNRAQATEKNRLQVLLADLCRNVKEPDRAGRPGRRPHLVKDAIFSMAFKVYCGFSSRRFSSDLLEAHERGYVSKPIPGVKVCKFLENPEYTPILTELVARSAAPLAAVETDFAVDSSGFSSSRFERWYDEKYGAMRSKNIWVKAHVAVGVKTNVITSVRILKKDSGDSPQFRALVQETRKNFKVNEVSGDKAYLSLENMETAAECGGTAFIAFKANSTGAAGGEGGLFEKMFHFFQFKQDEYMACYHKRSNVESTFSALKRKFGDSVLSKTDTGMRNEVLCKMLCHNLTCLIQEQETLGIVPIFWKNEDAKGCNELAASATI